jgi:hypothetical protein
MKDKIKDKVNYNKLINEIGNHIHESMCVDGFVKFDSFINEIERNGKKLDGMLLMGCYLK